MTQLTTRKIFTAVGAIGLSLAAAACGSSSSTSASSTSTSAAPAAQTSAPAVQASAPAVQASAASSATPSAAPAAMLKIDQTSLGSVLTNVQGFTVYWFAKDTATNSACSGACAAAWPPVIGIPQAASGFKLTGKLGEIKRADGSMQATYDGHPLYLFAGDSKPGQVNGNAIDGFDALWYAIKIGASTTASTTGSGNSGSSGSGGSGDMSGGSSGGSSGGGGGSGSGSGGGGGGGGW